MSVAERLINEVIESPRLPSLPVVALEVVELSRRADVSVESLASILKQDPALSTKVLKTVNSSFYGQSRSIVTLNQAIVILGLNTVRALALGFSLVDGLGSSSGDRFDYDSFWRRSIRRAASSRVLAARIPSVDPEEAFLCGLLGRLGVLALSSVLGHQYQECFDRAGGDYGKLLESEQRDLGLDHIQVGARMAERWNLPLGVTAAIGFITDPDHAPEPHRELVRVVAAADGVAGLFEHTSADAFERYRAQCEEWFGIPPAEAEWLVGATDETVHSISRLLDIPTDGLPPAAAILSRANEALAEINLQVSQDQGRLAAENVALVNDALTDSLTFLANRRHFDQFLVEQVRIARRYGGCVGLLMIDLDHFKSVNDHHGHPMGDLVLQEVGAALRGLIREADLVARYGGEEFAVVMPQSDLTRSGLVAERARLVIRDCRVVTESGASLSITASVGVAALDGRLLEDQQSLVSRADRALYRAKQAGRNRVVALADEQAA